TLLNTLTGSKALAVDKLFATLDPTTRRLHLPSNQDVLLTDTVGFIRKLPHGLVEAFKATLEEVVQADLLIHVVDVTTHPDSDRTLLNTLTGSKALAVDKLFATLDPTTRRLHLPSNQDVLLTDTVGFIRKLPHGLVEAFKATLEEVVQADLLIHVVDVTTHPD